MQNGPDVHTERALIGMDYFSQTSLEVFGNEGVTESLRLV